MCITDNIVIVEGQKFQIDRSKPEIVASLGKGIEIQNIEIQVRASCVAPFTEATIMYVITYNGELKSIQISGENVEIPQPVEIENGKQYTVTKNVTENGDYKIYVTDANDGYKIATAKVRNIVGDLDIWTLEEFVAFRDKVNQGVTYQGYTIRLMADIDLSSACSEGKGDLEMHTKMKLCILKEILKEEIMR